MDNLLTQKLPRLLQLLEDKGWVELPNAVPKSVCPELSAVLEERYASGAFRGAEIGQGKDQIQRADVRSDSIHWLEKDDPQLRLLRGRCFLPKAPGPLPGKGDDFA